jgi:hypothetical protein
MNGSINGADDPAAGRGTPAQAPPWLSPGAFWDHAPLALKRAVEDDVVLDLSEPAVSQADLLRRSGSWRRV